MICEASSIFLKKIFPQAYFFLRKESSSLNHRSSAKWKICFLLNHYFHIRRDRAEWIFIKFLYQNYPDIHVHCNAWESRGTTAVSLQWKTDSKHVHLFLTKNLDFIKNYLLSWQQFTFLSLPADQETERRNPLFTLTTLTSKILNMSFFQLVQYGAKWYLKS